MKSLPLLVGVVCLVGTLFVCGTSTQTRHMDTEDEQTKNVVYRSKKIIHPKSENPHRLNWTSRYSRGVLSRLRKKFRKISKSKHAKQDLDSSPSSEQCTNPRLSSCSSDEIPLNVNGIFPSITATASSGPKRSECGTGALMAWADKLYMVSYLSVPNGGSGTGLYAIDQNFKISKLADHNSTYANRIIHKQTNQIIIGPWAIDVEGKVRVFQQLLTVRVTATAVHLTKPETMVYMLGMDGPLWECDVTSLECTQLFNLVETLNIPVSKGEQPHFKAAHSMDGYLIVASNTFEEQDFTGQNHGGRLAEWAGPGHNWTILEETAFVEVTGRANFGRVIYALGWDYRSVILKVYDGDNPDYRHWQTYRLPKGSHAYDHLWQTEWPRIREVETERYLMDMHGLFYELSPLGWVGSTWGLRPVSQHLRMIPDFASFRGFLVLGGNQVSSIFDNNVVTGQAQSGLWFGKTDDLWSFGKPQGWGAVWRTDNVTNGNVSDPYLMTGFDKKVLHVILHDTDKAASVTLQVDVTGAAGHRSFEEWVDMETLTVGGKSPTYRYFTFPQGFSAHWIRLKLNFQDLKETGASDSCMITAYFHYT